MNGRFAIKIYTETYHRIELRRKVGDGWTVWVSLTPERLFRHVELMAYHGRLIEAIEEAQRTWLSEIGQLHDVEFRTVTKSQTVTATTQLHDGWTDQ